MAYGNLSTTINAAVSGRTLAQNNAAIIAQNLSNAETEGYSRQELKFSTQMLGGIGCGVVPKDLIRITDMFKIEQMRSKTSDLSQLATLNTFYTNLNQNLGQPGENNSLSASLNNLKKMIESLSRRPEVDGERTAVIRAAQNLAQDLGRMSNIAQDARKMADAQIYECVQDVNNLLTNLSSINKEIQYSASQGQSVVGLLDQRDSKLKELSELMDIRVQYASDGQVNLFSNGGGTLLQTEVHQLDFSQTSGINATVTYASGTMNGILIDGDPAKDITTFISGGKLGGYIMARDADMPAFQDSLDEMTAVLRDQMNAVHNRGTAAGVPQTLSGTRTGLTVADNVVGLGTVKVALVDRATGNLVEQTTIDLSTIGTIGGIINQMNTLGMVANLDANGVMQVQANNPAYGVAIASSSPNEATITSGAANYGFSHYFGLNDFYVTGNTVTGKATGIASQLAVRQELVDDVSRLAHTVLDVTGAIGSRVLTAGGNSTLVSMTQMFGQEANFAASGKISGLITSLSDYCNTVIQYTAAEGRYLNQTLENESAIYDLGIKSLESIRGVNIQEEIMSLMQWQRQMKVCTQLMLTAEDMMQELMRIKR